MALGDLVGEVGNTYLTAAERAARAGIKPSLADGFNQATGPVGRATQQLTSLSQLAPPFTPPAQTPAPSLTDAFPGSAQTQPSAPAPQLSLSSAAPGGPQSTPPPQPVKTPSLADAGSSIGAGLLAAAPAVAQAPASLSDAAPTGVLPVAGSPTYPTASQQTPSLADAAPQVPASGDTAASPVTAPAQPATLSLDQARPVVGGSDTSNANTSIVGSLAPDGTAQFSNARPDLASAYGQAPVAAAVAPTAARVASLEDGLGARGGPATANSDIAGLGSSRAFGRLGSASNIGDGIGGFSQSNAGDGALAKQRNLLALDLRQGYREQDALAEARRKASVDDSFRVVGDSSRPLTRSDLAQAGLDQQERDNDQKAIASAQDAVSTGIAQRAATTQARQAQNLEDVRVAAASPNATPQQKAAYQALIDPDGSKALARQTQQAQLANTQAETALRQQQQKNTEITQQQTQQDRVRTQAGKLATIDQAIGSVDSLLGKKVNPKNPNGARVDEDPGLSNAVGLVSALPTIPGSKSADFEARLDTLKAQSFLPQVEQLKGAGALSDAEGKKLSDSVGALSIKMSPEAFRKSLAEIRTSFAAARDRVATAQSISGTARPAAAAGSPAVGTVQQGYVFLGGDPASQGSWRKQ